MMCVFRVLSRELCVPVYLGFVHLVYLCTKLVYLPVHLRYHGLLTQYKTKKRTVKGLYPSTVRYLRMFLGSSMVAELAGILPSFLQS